MCTAVTYQTNHTYFGRNLDYEMSYGEEVTIIPRHFPLHFRELPALSSHHAIIGIAYNAPVPADQLQPGQPDTYPLLYDGANEHGLAAAGLLFAGNAVYHDHVADRDNLAQFEFLPWILGQCRTVAEVKPLLARLNLRNLAFSPELPPSELHWLISDATNASIVVESVADGLKIYDNPLGVLTNNPPFDQQFFNLNNYMHLSATDPVNTFAPDLPLHSYSRGLGGLGLPGDLSSSSRFVKAAFTKLHSLSDPAEIPSVSQFFHILHSVDQQRGCSDLGDQKYEITIYSDCYDLNTGTFYYTTYNNHQISAVKLSNANLDGHELQRFPFLDTEQINYQN